MEGIYILLGIIGIVSAYIGYELYVLWKGDSDWPE